MNVGIIGAGIGGTCLAHGLRKNGIDVTIFEKRGQYAPQLAGYGIHINGFGQEALKACLPAENWAAMELLAKKVGGKKRFYNNKLKLLLEHTGRNKIGDQIFQENQMAISRIQLKEILSNGLEDFIIYDKEFSSYKILPDSTVQVFFTDGSDSLVDLLVAADASNSKVRQQFLPSLKRVDLGITAISGRTLLTDHLRNILSPDLYDGTPNSIVPATSDWMVFFLWHAPVNTDADSKTTIENFLFWGYVTKTAELKQAVSAITPEGLCNYVCAKTLVWDQRINQIVLDSDKLSVAAIELKSMEEIPEWEPSTVTLMGDAIHNMTPMAGVGANTALRDARSLTEKISRGSRNNISIQEIVGEYEKEMRVYANRSVGLSRKNAERAVDEALWKRHVFRFILRIFQQFPFLKPIMFRANRVS